MKRIVRLFLMILPVVFTMGVARADNAQCLRGLATDLADTILGNVNTDDAVIITSDSLVEYFTKNIDICRDYLLARVSPDEDISVADIDLVMDIRWDYIVEEVAAALSVASNQRTLFVCENNRSYEMGIEVGLWMATVVAAAFSWGSGGVAIQGAKTAVVQAGKNFVKIGVRKGAKTAVVQAGKNFVKIGVRKGAKKAAVDATAKRLGIDIAAKAAAESAARSAAATATAQATAAKAAADAAGRTMARDATITAVKRSMHNNGVRRVQDAALRAELQARLAATPGDAALRNALNLVDDKISKVAAKKTAERTAATAAADLSAAEAALLAETSAASNALTRALTTFALSTPIAAAGGVAAVYSFLTSELNPKIMNCTDTDAGEGCYLSCTKDPLGSPTDDLNTKVFRPVFGQNLCVDENSNYALRVINRDGLPVPGDIFKANQTLWDRAKAIIVKDVVDRGNCDWNEDDIDMYIGVPLYDAGTLMPTGNGATSIIIDAIRPDD